jgi:hypothetical protein
MMVSFLEVIELSHAQANRSWLADVRIDLSFCIIPDESGGVCFENCS